VPYFHSDTPKNEWRKKKQTPEERRAAKLAKLNPNNHPTALDVMREKELKRKREFEGDLDADEDGPHRPEDMEKPREGMKSKKLKLDRVEDHTPSTSKSETKQSPDKKSNSEKRKEKDQRKKEKRARKEEKRKSKQARKEVAEQETEEREQEQAPLSPSEHHDIFLDSVTGDIAPFDASGLADEHTVASAGSASPSPPPDSTFSHASKLSASSTSTVPSLTSVSALPTFVQTQEHLKVETASKRLPLDLLPALSVPKHPQEAGEPKNPQPSSEQTLHEHSQVLMASTTNTFTASKLLTTDQSLTAEYESVSDKPMDLENDNKVKLSAEDKESAAQRLRDKIAALRAARKADGPDGRPARSRQELIEARRKEQEKRKQRKKEARKQSKEEEARAKAEAELALLRGSGSPIGSPGDVFSLSSRRSSPDRANLNFGFSRVAWSDGTHLDKETSGLNPAHKRKGPSDPRTALEAAQKKDERLAGLDPQKRADIEEKDAWLNAKRKAHGERVRDDTSLLKKALKRKEGQKQRSEKQWQDRVHAVEKGKQMRQQKREDNLRKRREEKGKKGKKVKRPGFEGSFRARPKQK